MEFSITAINMFNDKPYIDSFAPYFHISTRYIHIDKIAEQKGKLALVLDELANFPIQFYVRLNPNVHPLILSKERSSVSGHSN